MSNGKGMVEDTGCAFVLAEGGLEGEDGTEERGRRGGMKGKGVYTQEAEWEGSQEEEGCKG